MTTGPSLGAKIGFGLAGYVVGAFPLAFTAEYRSALGRGDNPGLHALAFATGIGGVLFALWVLKRRHGARAAQAPKPENGVTD